jgi:hypothetical protein
MKKNKSALDQKGIKGTFAENRGSVNHLSLLVLAVLVGKKEL